MENNIPNLLKPVTKIIESENETLRSEESCCIKCLLVYFRCGILILFGFTILIVLIYFLLNKYMVTCVKGNK